MAKLKLLSYNFVSGLKFQQNARHPLWVNNAGCVIEYLKERTSEV